MLTVLVAMLFAMFVIVAILGLFVKGTVIVLAYLDIVILLVLAILIVVHFIKKREGLEITGLSFSFAKFAQYIMRDS